MFKVELLVDDKKVGKVLWALDGLALIEGVTPMRNVRVKKGRAVEAGDPTTAKETLKKFLGIKAKMKDIKLETSEAVEFGVKEGFTKGALYVALKEAVKDKILKRQSRGNYTIIAAN